MFYYLLAGASEEERTAFHLKKPEEYHYLSQVGQKNENKSSCLVAISFRLSVFVFLSLVLFAVFADLCVFVSVFY